MPRKTKQPPEPFENMGQNNKFVRLFIGQIDSEAFKKLNPRQRTLYLYMKAQYRGKETKNNPNGKKDQFYFNWRLANTQYRLYTNMSTFYNDIKVLEEYGFIVCVERNWNLRKKNVYAFSDQWKQMN